MRLALLPVLALVLAAALAACGSSSNEGGSGESVSIGEKEFSLDPSSVQVQNAGTVTIEVTNNGSIDHAFEVEGQGVEEETETIAPGDTAELTVDLSKTGSYEIYCPIDGHREKGMEGTLTVGAAAGAGTTGTTEDEGATTQNGGGYGYGNG
jgi:uncharacterized cupredoxin-like copper-binding protein